MKLFDVNILVQAFREDSPDHALFHETLSREVNLPVPFGMCRVAVSGFLRIVTNRKVFKTPAPMRDALAFCDDLTARPNFRWIEPGKRHWTIFRGLCLDMRAEGNLIPDLWFAALAMESGCVWVSGDRDYGLVPNLAWEFLHE